MYEPHPAKANKKQASAATTTTNETTGITLAGTPELFRGIDLNGAWLEVGDGVKTKDFYFSSDGGTTAKTIAQLQAGDTAYWTKQAARENYNLATSDKISIHYDTIKGV